MSRVKELGMSGRLRLTSRSPKQNDHELDRFVDQIPGVREQLDRFESSLAIADKASQEAYNSLLIKPGPQPKRRPSLQWQVLIPFALAYSGIGGYAVAYFYLCGFYSAVLPGIPIAYPYLDTLRVLVMMPLVFLFALVPLTFIGLSATQLPREVRRCLMDALPHLERLAKNIHAAEDALRRLAQAVSLETEAGEQGEVLGNEREALAFQKNRSVLARQRTLSRVGLSWSLPYRLATSSLRDHTLLLCLGLPLFFAIWPILVIGQVDASWLAMLLDIAFGFGLIASFLLLFVAWRVVGLTFKPRPGKSRLARLSIVLTGVAALLIASNAGGVVMGYTNVLGRNFVKVSATLQNGSTVSGYSVRVESSPNLYLLTNMTGPSRTVRIIAPNQIESVVGQTDN
jgi:hypothetical protein